MKEKRTVEIYYGYYSGDAQFWDTKYVEIPADTSEDKVTELAYAAFLDALPCDNDNLAFYGIFNDNIGEEDGSSED